MTAGPGRAANIPPQCISGHLPPIVVLRRIVLDTASALRCRLDDGAGNRDRSSSSPSAAILAHRDPTEPPRGDVLRQRISRQRCGLDVASGGPHRRLRPVRRLQHLGLRSPNLSADDPPDPARPDHPGGRRPWESNARPSSPSLPGRASPTPPPSQPSPRSREGEVHQPTGVPETTTGALTVYGPGPGDCASRR